MYTRTETFETHFMRSTQKNRPKTQCELKPIILGVQCSHEIAFIAVKPLIVSTQHGKLHLQMIV